MEHDVEIELVFEAVQSRFPCLDVFRRSAVAVESEEMNPFDEVDVGLIFVSARHDNAPFRMFSMGHPHYI